MRLLVIGVACAGKTTVARHLRGCSDLNVVDMDDAIGRLNGGVWPDIPTKNNVVLPKVLAEVRAMSDVVLFGSLPFEQTQKLRQEGFGTVLLDVSEDELRRRHAVRLVEEGWTNVQWFEHEQSVIRELRDHAVFDYVISGEQSVASVADKLLSFAEDRRIRHPGVEDEPDESPDAIADLLDDAERIVDEADPDVLRELADAPRGRRKWWQPWKQRKRPDDGEELHLNKR